MHMHVAITICKYVNAHDKTSEKTDWIVQLPKIDL